MTSPHEGKTMCHPETPGTSLRTCPWCNGIRDISRVIVGEVFGTVPSFRRYTYLKSFYLPMRKVSSPKRQRDSRVSTYYLRFSDSWDQRMSFLFPFFLSCHFSGQTHYKCFFVFTYQRILGRSSSDFLCQGTLNTIRHNRYWCMCQTIKYVFVKIPRQQKRGRQKV